MAVPDHILVERLQHGDRAVMSDIYDRYADTLYGILAKIVRSEATAEDLLQETFVKVWLQKDRYDATKGSFFTWMLNIARNMAIDTLRSGAYKASMVNRSVDDIVGMEHEPGEDAVIPEHTDLRTIVATLGTEQRAIVDLMYFQGYTQTEISEEFDIPLGTVKSRLRLAMNTLRSYFADDSR